MQLVAEPYFISPHAYKRYIERIRNCGEIEAIQQIQLDLQNAKIVERFLDKRVYDCKGYFALVGPPKIPREQEWPTVITIIDPTKYDPVHKPFYGKPNPWRDSKRDIWQPAEKHYLRCHWGYLPSKTIARHLGRTQKAVQQQAYKMGLTKKSYRKWNQAEIDVLNWFYSTTTVSLASNLLGRSKPSVKTKAALLNLGNKEIPTAWQLDTTTFASICRKVETYIDIGYLTPAETLLHLLVLKDIESILAPSGLVWHSCDNTSNASDRV
ncbi:MAG TPA: hypothetical protein PKJ49_10850 [Limnochordia bacterium]|jgi:hypothetical protein|nr:hypothetical protein [Limnochordia bacterium]